MSTPKSVAEVIADLRKERMPLAARLDAIDLAIENLSRVYGINGAPQPLPLEPKKREKKPRLVTSQRSEEPDARREQILSALGRSPVGLTAAELKKQTPKMDAHDRSNALTFLKAKGLVRRAGNTWVKVTEAA